MVVRVKCESKWNAICVVLLSRLWFWLSINLLGMVVARLNDRNRIATFIENLAFASDFSEKIRVVTTSTTNSEKSWKRYGILDVWWMRRWIQQVTIVSFETRNLCAFLLGLFRSIISSLVSDYYLISFYFNQFHLSTYTRYYISYFIAISCCRRHQFFSAIHVRSAVGDLSTIIRS